MKKLIILLILVFFAANLFAAGETETETATDEGVNQISFWTFQELHLQFYEDAVIRWNAANPNRQIELVGEVYAYDDMHNKLLIAIQSGVGAPDIVDIEISKFPNFLKGEIRLAEMNEYVNPVKSQFIESRLDIYAKNGKYYGLPFHVGAAVMYYNTEILAAAGVDPYSIDTWDDYVQAGLAVKEATGKPMTTVETTDQWTFWPMICQRDSDFFDAQGNVILDNATNISVLEFLYDMVYKYEIAVPAPDGFHHSEQYWGAMNNGDYASILMPMWYMGRFTDYMTDLSGKMIIMPLPRWEPGGKRSAGMGGTGTVVTTQAANLDLAREFLAFAKLSREGNIKLWELLGFDPPRWDVWSDPALQEPNKFTEFFLNDDLFATLLEIKDEINPVSITAQTPDLTDLIRHTVMFQALQTREKTPEQALTDAANELR